jgi:hypothetical protein
MAVNPRQRGDLPQQVHHFFVSEQESVTRSPLLNYRPKTQRHCALPLPDNPRHTRRIQSGHSQFQTRHLACLATMGTATTDSMARAVGAFCRLFAPERRSGRTKPSRRAGAQRGPGVRVVRASPAAAMAMIQPIAAAPPVANESHPVAPVCPRCAGGAHRDQCCHPVARAHPKPNVAHVAAARQPS